MAGHLPPLHGPSLTLESRRAALALLDSEARKELDIFRRGPLSPAQVVQANGKPMYAVMRLIRRWVGLGILKVHEERKRAGRPVKRYGLVAHQFFVPHGLVSVAEVHGMITAPFYRQMSRNMERMFLEQTNVTGTLVLLTPMHHKAFVAESPELIWDTAQPGAPAMHDFWLDVRLDYQEARQLREELEGIVARYGQKKGAQTYRLHLNLVPAPGDWIEE